MVSRLGGRYAPAHTSRSAELRQRQRTTPRATSHTQPLSAASRRFAGLIQFSQASAVFLVRNERSGADDEGRELRRIGKAGVCPKRRSQPASRQSRDSRRRFETSGEPGPIGPSDRRRSGRTSEASAMTKANAAPIAALPAWPKTKKTSLYRPPEARRYSRPPRARTGAGWPTAGLGRSMSVTAGRSWHTGERNPSHDDLERSIEYVRFGVTTQNGQMR
jgi:hypothetical protein